MILIIIMIHKTVNFDRIFGIKSGLFDSLASDLNRYIVDTLTSLSSLLAYKIIQISTVVVDNAPFLFR